MPTESMNTLLKPINHQNAGSSAARTFGEINVPILRVEGLIKIYGKRRVVDGVSFYVNAGEIVGLLGPNGAGKTTSFRMTCGLIDTSGGLVFLDGKDATNWPMYRRSREGGMGYLPQEASVFRNLSVQDNLLGVMEMLGMSRRARRERCDELLEKFNLIHLRRNRGSGLSGGERRRLEIARALVSRPKIMLLDEPFANIDPVTVHSIQEIIRQLAVDGISILITDHQVRETLQITQRSYVIRAGQVLCHGTPEEVLNNEEARKVYFGEDVAIGMSSMMRQQRHQAEQSPITQINEAESPVVVPDHHPRHQTRPRPKPRQLPATYRIDKPEPEPETTPTRKVEQFPTRPVVRSTIPKEETPPPRPTPRAIEPPPTSPIPQTSPTKSGIMETINVLLWGK
ncbi:MAG: LPS export ABC transporter ATP-binding protein [Planctomycetaceae bacterium]|nr:LPS export ABC transporter ATP-binding protein [Planctomycetaceae bacterium]